MVVSEAIWLEAISESDYPEVRTEAVTLFALRAPFAAAALLSTDGTINNTPVSIISVPGLEY